MILLALSTAASGAQAASVVQREATIFGLVMEEATFADHWNTVGGSASELVGRPTIIQQRPTQLTDDEQVCSLGNGLARRSAMLAHYLESFSSGHAGEAASERDQALNR